MQQFALYLYIFFVSIFTTVKWVYAALSFLIQSECVLFITTSSRLVRETEFSLFARQEVRVLLNTHIINITSNREDKINNRRDKLFGIF